MKKIVSDHFPSGKWKKNLFFMRVCIFTLLCSVGIMYAAPSFSQQTKMDVSYRNENLRSVLGDLQKRTGYQIIYFQETIPANTSVTFEKRNAELSEILTAILTPNDLAYTIEDDVVTIAPAPVKAVRQQTPQNVQVSGRVVDSSQSPMPGVAVVVPGTTTGVSTNANGEFTINVPVGSQLEFSFIGFVKELRTVNAATANLIITLEQDAVSVDDVIVTGIFTRSRESNTGAVTVATREELDLSGNRSILSALQNIDPSFNIVEDISYGSDPNRLPEINMRGRTSMDVNVRELQEDTNLQSESNLPLFILNGFEISLQRVMDMDQELVESITLLKDASATALYGSRGANGIVVITTRKPKPGQLRVSYRGSVNIEMPDFTSYNLMNSREKLEYERKAGLYNSRYNNDNYLWDQIYNRRLTDMERGVDTYWLKYPVRTAVGHRHSVTADGGTESFTYSATLGYNNIAGVMKDSYRNTFSGNIFLQYEYKNLKFQNDLTISHTKSQNSPYGSFSEYSTMNPLYTPYDDNGVLKKMANDEVVSTGSSEPQVVGNPLYNATLPTRDDATYTTIQNNFAIEWYILPELFVRGRFTFTKQDDRSDKYLSREHTSFEDYKGDRYRLRGSYEYGTGYIFNYEGDITVSYNKNFNNLHQVYAGINFNFADDKNETYGIFAQGFSALNKINIGLASTYAEDSQPTSNEEHSRRFGTTYNLNYTYNRRYFADFSGKFEGSSKFGANDRIAPFWSAGIGWNVHQENFLSNSRSVNSLRLRFSYGTSGSQNFNPYQALTTYRYYKEVYQYWNGASIIALGNPDLSWQKTKQANIGMEAQLFDNRVRFNIDFYNKLTEDLLTDVNLPTAGGFQSYKANVGEVRNRGVEFNTNVFLIRDPQRQITWSVGGSLVYNKNKILKISNALEFLNEELLQESGSNPSFLYEEGRSMNTIYVVRSLGIDPANGREIFLTKDGRRTYDWNSADKVACGIKEPKVKGNFSTLFRWKNITLNAIFSYRAGGDVYNQTLVDKVENITKSSTYNSPWRNLDRRALYGRWQQAGDNAAYKNITDLTETNASSRFVMRENMFKLSSVNLSYDFDTEWTRKKIGLSYLSVGLYAEDVFQVSTIKQERGTSYPFSRKYSVSVSARF